MFILEAVGNKDKHIVKNSINKDLLFINSFGSIFPIIFYDYM